MNDKRTATVRTTMPAAWTAVLLWAVGRLGFDLSEDDWQVLLVVAPFVAGVVYRLGREIEVRWPTVGRVLFGSNRQPHYEQSTGSG